MNTSRTWSDTIKGVIKTKFSLPKRTNILKIMVYNQK